MKNGTVAPATIDSGLSDAMAVWRFGLDVIGCDRQVDHAAIVRGGEAAFDRGHRLAARRC